MWDTRPLGFRREEGGYHDLKSNYKPFYVADYHDKSDLVKPEATNLFQHLIYGQSHFDFGSSKLEQEFKQQAETKKKLCKYFIRNLLENATHL